MFIPSMVDSDIVQIIDPTFAFLMCQELEPLLIACFCFAL
jgi:hypothetical protein